MGIEKLQDIDLSKLSLPEQHRIFWSMDVDMRKEYCEVEATRLGHQFGVWNKANSSIGGKKHGFWTNQCLLEVNSPNSPRICIGRVWVIEGKELEEEPSNFPPLGGLAILIRHGGDYVTYFTAKTYH
ncbi:hypothetical protein A3F02_03480 [Candidatus Curtissbacteria bacterium RIFCSPHIGHO2_12_FULL_38_9b]|uniref:Uncharacterized protein n=2 Tax=Candidatus Curtissiibacteriota TaxID=1752717 RepID=A0A1F5GZQ2_9BACT|nr:MAG: hypothetical protein A3A48_00090 [Candidatus Curtissbacteria bacterium RIFCSPLOWO2_01_FULL_37_9]OGD97343.1 MAG: hypothetical protein A3F02_03480 [Candidatus Curtissbacteria bacterium RIFCSPHIGHO2_12_FULL_38_9b]